MLHATNSHTHVHTHIYKYSTKLQMVLLCNPFFLLHWFSLRCLMCLCMCIYVCVLYFKCNAEKKSIELKEQSKLEATGSTTVVCFYITYVIHVCMNINFISFWFPKCFLFFSVYRNWINSFVHYSFVITIGHYFFLLISKSFPTNIFQKKVKKFFYHSKLILLIHDVTFKQFKIHCIQ